MIIELTTLPPAVQQWFNSLPDSVSITKTKNNITVQNAEFDYDLERMKWAMQGLETPEEIEKNSVEVPDWAMTDLANFNKWLANA